MRSREFVSYLSKKSFKFSHYNRSGNQHVSSIATQCSRFKWYFNRVGILARWEQYGQGKSGSIWQKKFMCFRRLRQSLYRLAHLRQRSSFLQHFQTSAGNPSQNNRTLAETWSESHVSKVMNIYGTGRRTLIDRPCHCLYYIIDWTWWSFQVVRIESLNFNNLFGKEDKNSFIGTKVRLKAVPNTAYLENLKNKKKKVIEK